MKRLGQFLRNHRTAREMTLQALADTVRCHKSYLSQIENGKTTGAPSPSLLARLEEALRLEPGILVKMASFESMPEPVRAEMREMAEASNAGRRLAELVRSQSLDDVWQSGELQSLVDRLSGAAPRTNVELVGLPIHVPVINSVAAGYPREFTDLGYPARVADDHVRVPDVSDPDAFGARVVGDSMSPQYAEGDIVVFSPELSAVDGDDCFVRLERDAETTFKRVYFEREGDEAVRIRLQPLNSRYGPRVVHREEVAGLYVAVRVIRSVGPEQRPKRPMF
ncbi:MAG: helix-turn-helix domain-containing protein [Phycisphaerales bacterium]